MSARLVMFLVVTASLPELHAAANAENARTIVLWPNGAPGSEGATTKELVKPRDATHLFTAVSQIHSPSLLAYFPPEGQANGAAMIVAPGGGHAFLAIDVEGYEIADWLNAHGIAAFILKYRLAREPGSKYTVAGNAIPDAQRAIRLVRSHAAEFHIDPTRIAFMGFSAGGEVAALAGLEYDAGNLGSSDPINKVSSRPDLNVVVYPGFKPEVLKQIPKDVPPTFIACASDDRSHIPTTVNLYTKLEESGAPVEMHLYQHGGHGFGMRDRKGPVTQWNSQLLAWLNDQHFLGAH